MTRRPTRSQLIGGLVNEAALAGRIGWRDYATRVVDHYHASVECFERCVRFQAATTADDYEQVVRNNTQTVRRYVLGERQLPADLEESLVAALPAEDAERVQTALLARSGLMYARQPPQAGDGAGQVRCATDLMRRAADAVDSVADMLADQEITPEDAPHFPRALDALNGVMGACLTLNGLIVAAMGKAPAAAGGKAVH